MKRYDVLTLHPEMVTGPLGGSILGRAAEAGRIAIGIHDIRDHAPGRHRQADDAPFGGGAGMVLKVDVVAAAEARGFLIGTPLASQLDVGFAPLRKPGKLPYSTHSAEYELEYGTDELHVHIDAVQPGQRVLLVDDLLATGTELAGFRSFRDHHRFTDAEIDALVASGKLSGRVGKTYTLDEAPLAMRDMLDRRGLGKLVITPA